MNGQIPLAAGLAHRVRANLAAARDRMSAAGGDPHRITVVAVTKGFGSEAVAAARAAGLDDIGENYADELVAKAAARPDLDVRWHFLGALQTNKLARLAPLVHVWQTVDSREHAAALGRRAPGASVLIQVNLTGGSTRGGCAPGAAAAVGEAAVAAGLAVRGLMGVGPDPSAFTGTSPSRRAFALLRELAAGLGVAELSMGMSADLESAVAEGATMVRLGTALFGERPVRHQPDGAPAPSSSSSSGDVPVTSLDVPSRGRS